MSSKMFTHWVTKKQRRNKEKMREEREKKFIFIAFLNFIFTLSLVHIFIVYRRASCLRAKYFSENFKMEPIVLVHGDYLILKI
jgi:hypothetical protein